MPIDQPARAPYFAANAVRPAARTIPRCWLMADARLGDTLVAAVLRLPPRSAVVVRPYAMTAAQRSGVSVRAIRRAARARRHLLLIGGRGPVAGYDGRHLGGGGPALARGAPWWSLPVHDARDALRARRIGAGAVLVSPLFPTRSHPGARTLGLAGFARLAARAAVPAVALGGLDAARFVAARRHGAAGWAAIGAWNRFAG